MDEQRYAQLADRAFQKLLAGFDGVDPDDADAESAGDVVTVTLRGGRKIIVNTQRPARQIWLAGGTQAWHFSYDDAAQAWIDDKGQNAELFQTIARVARELGAVNVSFD